MMSNPVKIFAALIALMVWVALVLQFAISVPLYTRTGFTTWGALIQILSFFTIQSNLLVALALTSVSMLPLTSWGRFFSKPGVLTAVGVYICIVGLVYAIALRHIWDPQGLARVADELLHTVSPLAYMVFWLLFVSTGKMNWLAMLKWAIFPLTYLGYTLARGSIINWYPYPFLNVVKLGYGRVVINSVAVLLVFLVFSTLFIGLSRLRAGNKNA